MLAFEKLNNVNGFDKDDLINAKQNNYAWSMAEFGDYIYVGTGRNIASYVVNLIELDVKLPLLIRTTELDNSPEIWRYKKDGTEEWKKVYKADGLEKVIGFRFMMVHAAKNSSPALYVSTTSQDDSGVFVLKTTDGSNWEKVGGILNGNSSRAMESFNGKLYVATFINSSDAKQIFLLYESEEPEIYDFKLSADFCNPAYEQTRNPSGSIMNMAAFNDKIYVCTNSSKGFEVWRTNTSVPKLNDWTKVIDNGFGDEFNAGSVSMDVYKNHLYISAVKKFPLILFIPLGAEVVRLDKNDKWELVVGGDPIKEVETVTGKRTTSISGYDGGFSNPFNIYVWQLKEYRGKLYASTFDEGANIEALRDILLLNRELIISKIGEKLYNLIVQLYDKILELFEKYNYQKGFSLYVSDDGVNFIPLSIDGLGNENNFGGRILMDGSDNKLYVGTANPYDGCEVLRICDPRYYRGSYSIKLKNLLRNIPDLYSEIEDLYDEILKHFSANEHN